MALSARDFGYRPTVVTPAAHVPSGLLRRWETTTLAQSNRGSNPLRACNTFLANLQSWFPLLFLHVRQDAPTRKRSEVATNRRFTSAACKVLLVPTAST